MASLHDTLWELTVDKLRLHLALLGIKPGTQKKAELIDTIKAALSGEKLPQEWALLSSLEQATLAEACHNPDYAHHESRIEAKYGAAPPFSVEAKEGTTALSRWDRSNPPRITLFLFYSKYTRQYGIPDDLAEVLRRFVPRPADLKITPIPAPIDEEGLFIRSTENEALSELPALLRIAEQGNLKITDKTSMPTAGGLPKILAGLPGGDFFPPEIAFPPNKEKWDQEIGFIKLVGWTRLLKTSGYLGKVGTKSKLTPAGIKALSKPPAQVARELWKKWLATDKFDEFNRIEDILGQRSKGHMTAKPPRRKAIVSALLECPPQEWIDLEKFSSFMQAEGFNFEVTRDPWKLYFCEQQYGSFGYDGFGGWSVVQHRYLLTFLFEYAATLGLIDIAYTHPEGALPDYRGQWGADDLEWLSRYDGLHSFRITNLGAYCLGLTKDFIPEKPSSSIKLAIYPGLTIHLQSGTPQPADLLLLETWTTPLDPGTWSLDPARSREAIQRGQNIADFRDFLLQASDETLPTQVEAFFKTTQSDATALKNQGEATLYQCRDEETAIEILDQKSFKKICHPCGPKNPTLIIFPTKHLAKFQKQVRSLGLGIV